jgi:hypothetical protein
MSVEQHLKIRPGTQKYYIDINTRNMRTTANPNPATPNPTIYGSSHSSFIVYLNIDLDPTIEYTVEVISWTYKTPTTGTPAETFPILLSDIGDPIIVNGFTSSILMRAAISAEDDKVYNFNTINNINFVRDIKYKTINSIEFNIVSSIDGKPFPLDETANANVNIILLIQNK